jgi:hypothetical protein
VYYVQINDDDDDDDDDGTFTFMGLVRSFAFSVRINKDVLETDQMESYCITQ